MGLEDSASEPWTNFSSFHTTLKDVDIFASSQLCPDQDPRPCLLQLMSNPTVILNIQPLVSLLRNMDSGIAEHTGRGGSGGKDSKTPREGIFIHSRTGTAGRYINVIKSILIVKICFELRGSLNRAKNSWELQYRTRLRVSSTKLECCFLKSQKALTGLKPSVLIYSAESKRKIWWKASAPPVVNYKGRNKEGIFWS